MNKPMHKTTTRTEVTKSRSMRQQSPHETRVIEPTRMLEHPRTNMPIVTVVITCYNAGAYLREAIESVRVQTYLNWRMIIVDDASSDDSIASVQALLTDPRIQLIRNTVNLGQTKSLNVALNHVMTPFMVQLDSDDWFLPNTLEVLVQTANQVDSNVALISGNIKLLWLDEYGREKRSLIRKGRRYRDKFDFLQSNRSCWPRFYRTSALRSVGGWPTDGPYEGRYIEDLRILFRLIPHYRFRWINQTLYIHRRHKHNMTRRIKEMKETLYWLIDDTLKRWGDAYRPKYRFLKSGYPQVKTLVPKKIRRQSQVKKQYRR